MKTNSTTWKAIAWAFGILFLLIGVLNIFLVHAIPGFFYIVLSFFFLPPANSFLRRSISFTVPPLAKIVLGLVVLWGTLAVGDLMEMFEAWYLR